MGTIKGCITGDTKSSDNGCYGPFRPFSCYAALSHILLAMYEHILYFTVLYQF